MILLADTDLVTKIDGGILMCVVVAEVLPMIGPGPVQLTVGAPSYASDPEECWSPIEAVEAHRWLPS